MNRDLHEAHQAEAQGLSRLFLGASQDNEKLLLYDDGEKLLECRILKKDEAVSCGKTLVFNAFLVDVNGAEGDQEEPPHSSNSLRRENRTAEKSKSQQLTLSPSQKIIREWEVLYTTQLTQKTKKYHDGFVQLSIRGSIGRQLMLFDACRNSLVSRFLRKGEKIESGATITLNGHLVEIGEPQGDENLKEIMEALEIIITTSKGKRSDARTWHVLYTTQLTQKSKKYHDGLLKLAICGSHGRQAMLYDETRKLLNTRFLKKDEVLRTGVSLTFDAYLIDIGEPEVKNETTAELIVQGNDCNVFKDTGTMHKQKNSLACNNYALKGNAHTNNCLRKDAESKFNISNIFTKEASMEDPSNDRLRDVRQILSILQKPRMENSTAAGYTGDKVTPAKGPIVSNAADLDLPEGDQPPKFSEPHDQSSENMDARESRECTDLDKPSDIMFSKEISSGSVNQLDKNIENGNFHQLYSEKTEVGAWCHGAYVSNMPGLTASCSPVGDIRNCSPELTYTKEMDECPSFDLGF